jgi:hypothetical protein
LIYIRSDNINELEDLMELSFIRLKDLVIAPLFIFLFSPIANSQDTIWTRTYGGIADDGAYSIQPTEDGGFIMAGYSESFGQGEGDFYIIRTDAAGDSVWTRTFGGISDEKAYCVQQTPDVGFIIAGYTTTFGGGFSDFYVVKTNTDGNLDWARTYGPEGYWRGGMFGFSIQLANEGGYSIAGSHVNFGPVSGSFFLVRTDDIGDTIWTRSYAGSIYGGGARYVQKSSEDGFILSGFSGFYGYLLEVRANGDTAWARSYNPGANCVLSSVEPTFDGGFIAVGSTRLVGEENSDVYIIKTDENGNFMWSHIYGGTDNDSGQSIKQVGDRGYIIAGITHSFGSGGSDVYLLRTDLNGDTLWTNVYGGSEDDGAYSIQQLGNSHYIVAGYTESHGSGLADCWILKIEDLITNVEDNDGLTPPSNFYLSDNYPNPFNPRTTFEYSLPEADHVTLEIYDILGRKVETLIDEQIQAGIHRILFDASNLSSGVYFYSVKSGDMVKTKRMVLLK